MRELKILVSDSMASSLQMAVQALGLAESEFLKKAIIEAIVKARPEYERPIQAIRAQSSYANASAPFLITGIARSNKTVQAEEFSAPLPMTVSQLVDLQNRGATHVSVSFSVDEATRYPDLTIRQLLGDGEAT